MTPRPSDLVPPLLTRAFRRSVRRDDLSVRRDGPGLYGDFPDWASALAASKPYETDLAVYGQITDTVRQGEAGSGRNLMPILAGIVMALDGARTRVLDFGGNLGVVYFDVTHVLPDRISEWRVVDCEEVASYGNANYADDKLAFFTSMEAASRDFTPNMVLCSHTLQYLENPYDTLAKLSALKPAVIVLHELPVAEHERFMIQRLPEGLGGTERPIQILSSGRLAAALSSYDLFADMDLPPWNRTLTPVMLLRCSGCDGFSTPSSSTSRSGDRCAHRGDHMIAASTSVRDVLLGSERPSLPIASATGSAPS